MTAPYRREALGFPPAQRARRGDRGAGGGVAGVAGVDDAGGGVVLACFNRVKKLDGKTWGMWLEILLQVPSADVCWRMRDVC